MDLVEIARQLRMAVNELSWQAPVSYVYNPLQYAWAAHEQYLRRYGMARHPQVLLVGMNPGPWGMAQTGVPFGDVPMVKNWMGIQAEIEKPAAEHPKKPVEGFSCRRREVSGKRLWGWARERFGHPDAFFSQFFVLNYCPLCFLEDSGRNRTPDKLPLAECRPLFMACDEALFQSIEILSPRFVLGVGRFALQRVERVVGNQSRHVGSVPHPSPANPAANRGWSALMEQALAQEGVALETMLVRPR